MKISDNVFRQATDGSLNDLPRHGDGPRQVRFTHILNPHVGKNIAQESALEMLTFETIRGAIRMAAPTVSVRCVCVTLPGETATVPRDFITAKPLTRTVLDIAAFNEPAPLPLIFDVMDHGIAVPEAPPQIPGCEDFIIFSNTDIHLQPHFYLAILEFIRAGYDVIDVHRRGIPNHAPLVEDLSVMFSEVGIHHGGCDCIVFPRRLYGTFARNNACIGRSFVMRAFVFNFVRHAKRYLILSNARLTFHIGNDRAWAIPALMDYSAFNHAESKRVLSALSNETAAANTMLSSFRAIGVGGNFIQTLEEAAGFVAPLPTLRRAVRRRFGRARRHLVRMIMGRLSRWQN
jgi:hypothetical protein